MLSVWILLAEPIESLKYDRYGVDAIEYVFLTSELFLNPQHICDQRPLKYVS